MLFMLPEIAEGVSSRVVWSDTQMNDTAKVHNTSLTLQIRLVLSMLLRYTRYGLCLKAPRCMPRSVFGVILLNYIAIMKLEPGLNALYFLTLGLRSLKMKAIIHDSWKCCICEMGDYVLLLTPKSVSWHFKPNSDIFECITP